MAQDRTGRHVLESGVEPRIDLLRYVGDGPGECAWPVRSFDHLSIGQANNRAVQIGPGLVQQWCQQFAVRPRPPTNAARPYNAPA